MKMHRFRLALALGLSLALMTLLLLLTSPHESMARPRGALAADPSTGDSFPIDATAGTDQFNPIVAHDEGRNQFLVVYENEAGIRAVCLNAQGDTLATYVVPASDGNAPDVVYSSDHDEYLIVWEDAGAIYGARVGGVCYAGFGGIGSAFEISGDRANIGEYDPAVAYNRHSSHQDYLVVWADTDALPSHRAIYARRVDGATVSGNSFEITSTTSAYNYEPDVAYNLNMNEYLVVYTHDPSKGTNQNARDIYGRRVYNTSGGGLLAEHPIDASGNSQDSPSVAAYRLNYTTPYLVVFEDDWNDGAGDVRGYLVYTTGLPHSLLNFAETSGLVEGEPDVTSSEGSGGYTVVWSQCDPSCDVYGQRVSGDGDMISLFDVYVGPGEQYLPAVASGSPVPLVVWQVSDSGMDVYGRLLYYRTYLPLVLRN
ncbi:MAG: hypothetical protein DRI77_04725 [Chloroflexi bacterium]|nr:MAG: hypothetical protein DRI77_04725 [Chloroflexota bacterium]